MYVRKAPRSLIHPGARMVASRARGSDANVICRRRRASLSAESSSLLKTRCRPLAARCLVLAACRVAASIITCPQAKNSKNSEKKKLEPKQRYIMATPRLGRARPRARSSWACSARRRSSSTPSGRPLPPRRRPPPRSRACRAPRCPRCAAAGARRTRAPRGTRARSRARAGEWAGPGRGRERPSCGCVNPRGPLSLALLGRCRALPGAAAAGVARHHARRRTARSSLSGCTCRHRSGGVRLVVVARELRAHVGGRKCSCRVRRKQ